MASASWGVIDHRDSRYFALTGGGSRIGSERGGQTSHCQQSAPGTHPHAALITYGNRAVERDPPQTANPRTLALWPFIGRGRGRGEAEGPLMADCGLPHLLSYLACRLPGQQGLANPFWAACSTSIMTLNPHRILAELGGIMSLVLQTENQGSGMRLSIGKEARGQRQQDKKRRGGGWGGCPHNLTPRPKLAGQEPVQPGLHDSPSALAPIGEGPKGRPNKQRSGWPGLDQ